jgi:hypothetical protein
MECLFFSLRAQIKCLLCSRGQAIAQEEEEADYDRLVNDPRAKENLQKETGDLDTKSAKYEAPVCVSGPIF